MQQDKTITSKYTILDWTVLAEECNATFLTVLDSFLASDVCTWCSIPVGLAGGVEHSRLKSVGEWLLLSRGLNPATARAWRRTEQRESVREEQEGRGGVMFLHLVYVHPSVRVLVFILWASSTWWCTRCSGTAVFWETSGLDCLRRHSRWKDDLRPDIYRKIC